MNKPGTSLSVPGKRYFLWGVALIAVILFFLTLRGSGLKTNYYSTALILSPSKPVEVIIPKLGLKAQTVELGLKDDKTLDVPRKAMEVGWYKDYPTPGERGPSILVGHLDWYRGQRGAFIDLDKLSAGDQVKVLRADGTTAIFEVSQKEIYPQDEFQTEKVYGRVDHAELRLITCTGDFLKQEDRYSHNLVVFADLVGYE